MKDSDLLILYAFLFALAQQESPLPESVQHQVRAIGRSLENQVEALDRLAEATPSLTVFYQQAYKLLSNDMPERAKGPRPARDDAGDTGQERENEIREIESDLTETRKLIELIQQRTTPAQSAAILSDPDPVYQARLLYGKTSTL